MQTKCKEKGKSKSFCMASYDTSATVLYRINRGSFNVITLIFSEVVFDKSSGELLVIKLHPLLNLLCYSNIQPEQ